jgi:predicted ABC-type ATPase
LTTPQSRPRLWIVAGPNGCGKSTAYGHGAINGFDGSVWIINPDLLTARLQMSEKLDLMNANLQAVQRIERWLQHSIDVYQTIGVETVLSTAKYRKLVSSAKERGFEFRLIYVIVDSVERQLERIRIRVEKGGHNVPTDKVIERRKRSLEQLGWFFWQADEAWVIDNSGSESRLVATWINGEVELSDNIIVPEIEQALFAGLK